MVASGLKIELHPPSYHLRKCRPICIVYSSTRQLFWLYASKILLKVILERLTTKVEYRVTPLVVISIKSSSSSSSYSFIYDVTERMPSHYSIELYYHSGKKRQLNRSFIFYEYKEVVMTQVCTHHVCVSGCYAHSLARRAIWLKAWHFHRTQPKLPSVKRMILCLSTRLEKTGTFLVIVFW